MVPDKPCAPSFSGSLASLKGLGWMLFGVDTHKYPLVDRKSLGYAPTRVLSLGLEQQNLNQQFRISLGRGSCLHCQPSRSAPGHTEPRTSSPPRRRDLLPAWGPGCCRYINKLGDITREPKVMKNTIRLLPELGQAPGTWNTFDLFKYRQLELVEKCP